MQITLRLKILVRLSPLEKLSLLYYCSVLIFEKNFYISTFKDYRINIYQTQADKSFCFPFIHFDKISAWMNIK